MIVSHTFIRHIHLILYLFGFILAAYVLVGAYIRIKMHFWHTQPVFHIYNLKYWLNPPGTINHEPPPVNKFVNLKNNTLLLVDASNASLSTSRISQFIRDNYLIHDATTYNPSEADILAYLQCSNQPAFFNVYQESPIPFGPTDREIVGVTSSRLLNVTLKKKKKPLTFPVYYVDNLCVKPGYRKKGIAPEMIQTFYYNVSRTVPNVKAYMFKREGQLNAIVPLVCYETYAFDMTHYPIDARMNAPMAVIEIGPQNLTIFIAFVKDQMPKFECVILPDISSVLNLIKCGNLKVYGILYQGELIAAYVFRRLELYYGEKKAVECIAILSNSKAQHDILTAGFALCWAKINAVTQSNILLIEATADSEAVIKGLDANPAVKRNFKSPTAFFLYNYATYSVRNTKALLIY